METYKETLKYAYPMSYKVSMYYAQRQFGRSTIVSVLFLVTFLGWFLYCGYYFEFSEIIALVLICCLGFYFWYLYEIQRRWKETLRRMGKPEAELVITDESFSISSGAGSSTIPWNQFSDLWKHKEFWLLFIDRHPMTIPLEGLDPECLKLIEEKITKSKKTSA